ncbi:hypothetical protein COCMIDRAFT_109418 [Bipolaris oryzae ATCC 44560]|uniref:Zn(2)-C6 fungal-type domain-containing protein n=1 Tax=Bipolaris oryzae ATCC 44560 TaxID=930090 RepID=W6YRG4_COCMI|nr:uncharacterized protein COCMIDRAFT_109418 [Bipolaris oryzae ATCC 44560]EUC40205.1 hypothetical protein COCMIDRAFT_109418 [Bipolaris oryzae ATCC 44560]
MELVAGKPRQRAWKPKARSGCKTCKIRRIKCDEQKPHCTRCTSTGRTCDGYDSNFRSPKPITSSPAEAQNLLSSFCSGSTPRTLRSHPAVPLPLAPALPFSTTEEKSSFSFFTSHAIPKLRGFLDSPFWQREVLQAAHREPAIQHCVIALGAMYRRFHEGSHSHIRESAMAHQHLQFAFLQSNRAIKVLLEKSGAGDSKTSGKDKMTLMTCAILFSSMCCLQGYQKHAVEHLRSGIRMLNEMDDAGETAVTEHAVELESLRTIFVALDAQIRAIMPSAQSRSWVKKPKVKSGGQALEACKKLSMASLQGVLRHMECLLSHIHAFNQKTFLRGPGEEEQVGVELRELVERFHAGAVVMKKLWGEAERGSRRDEFTQPLIALELMQCQMEYLLRLPRADIVARFPCLAAFQHAKEPFTTPFDEAALFASIFDLCDQLLVVPGNKSTPVFMTSMGPTAALWFIAIRAPASCQALRRRAVGLMLSHPRREGFWDGMVAGWIADEALSLEQERTRAELNIFSNDAVGDVEVPKHLRIISFWLTYPDDEDRKVRVGFSDAGDLAVGVPGTVKWFTW